MEYKILIIEKKPEDYCGDYKTIEHFVDSTMENLRVRGHQVTLRRDLDDVTEEEYSSADCVFAHPARKHFRKLINMKNKYPWVGLVVSPGGDKGSEEFHGLIQNEVDGIYALEKPFTMEDFYMAIEKAIGEAKECCI